LTLGFLIRLIGDGLVGGLIFATAACQLSDS